MKKIRIMVLSLIVAVAMMGAGYAAWSTKINYNDTMRTADWCVYIENDAVGDSLVAGDQVMNFNSDGTETGILSEDGYDDYDTVDSSDRSGAKKVKGSNFVYTLAPEVKKTVEKDDTVNFSFYNMHPGTKAITRFEIRNFGTIPAKVADVNVTVTKANGEAITEGDPVYNAIVVKGTFKDHIGPDQYNTIGNLGEGKKLYELENALKAILVNNPGFPYLTEQHRLAVYNEGPFDGSEMEVVNGLEFSIPANTLKNAAGENVGMLTDLKVKIEFDFVQYNQNIPNLQ